MCILARENNQMSNPQDIILRSNLGVNRVTTESSKGFPRSPTPASILGVYFVHIV